MKGEPLANGDTRVAVELSDMFPQRNFGGESALNSLGRAVVPKSTNHDDPVTQIPKFEIRRNPELVHIYDLGLVLNYSNFALVQTPMYTVFYLIP